MAIAPTWASPPPYQRAVAPPVRVRRLPRIGSGLPAGGAEEKAGEMAKATARPRPAWEELPDSAQWIYLALAEGEVVRARQLYDHDQRPPARRPRRAGGGAPAAAAGRPGRDLRGFVERRGRLEPREMAAAEAWKRRQARRGSSESV
jgi:hypothetical protein